MPALQDQRDRLLAVIPSLRRYARALVGERSLADRLVRDTLEHACCTATQTHCRRDVRPCLLGILHRRYLQGGDRAAPSVVPANTLDFALQALPGPQRVILLLVVLERMSCEEVARLTGLGPATVAATLSAGRDKLRTQLDTAALALLP
ncbi:MAG TPA: sigma factor-like helix-turn-helix DNA-binding protein [Aromatoleum sp.]|uniref:sigma factor-like helix-turn-helix DNA-binding protein n=1 Tax=Aromatoleum sp. TaxID=2307007 RepID=UPI002B474D28|nr:sigma factor-like helix-turn-helix DNA-binding protein [Aromatoleum sp.]HJV26978.1 sigma factor-like helix-turn-helix DNA-binding protein [Aromatoleum sp.]